MGKPAMLIEQIVFRSRVKATGGRDLDAVSSDGMLDLKLSAQTEAGASPGTPTPEHLFAACYAGSFLHTLKIVAGQEGIALPPDVSVEASVGVGPISSGFGIEIELRIELPGVPRAETDLLVRKSHALCPYSIAIQGNVPERLVVA
jgi:lipoyl-dependent peroxiredoxin